MHATSARTDRDATGMPHIARATSPCHIRLLPFWWPETANLEQALVLHHPLGRKFHLSSSASRDNAWSGIAFSTFLPPKPHVHPSRQRDRTCKTSPSAVHWMVKTSIAKEIKYQTWASRRLSKSLRTPASIWTFPYLPGPGTEHLSVLGRWTGWKSRRRRHRMASRPDSLHHPAKQLPQGNNSLSIYLPTPGIRRIAQPLAYLCKRTGTPLFQLQPLCA